MKIIKLGPHTSVVRLSWWGRLGRWVGSFFKQNVFEYYDLTRRDQ